MSEEETPPAVRFEVAGLLEAARAATGLSDFGDDDFREGLEVLAHCIEEEADLHGVGRAAQHARLVGSLETRLVAQDYLNRYPEIAEEKIREPLVVAGLARTGTTRLHRLLACDPDVYAVLWWEARWPSPLPGNENWQADDARVPAAQQEVQWILDHQPVLASIHPWDAEGPDEEIMLCEHAFKSWVPESFMNVPGYIAWLARQDLRPTYRYLKQMLQFLQWQKKRSGRSAQRWVLKAPFHLGFGDVLFETFPDARVIQTHRDPRETLPSITSMAYALWGLNRDDVDPHLVGEQGLARWSGALHSFMAFRKTMPPDKFFDCDFRAVGQDPLGEIRRIYEWIGLPLEPATEAAMEQWLIDNARGERPAHDYSLEKFGFSEAEIDREFSTYREQFGFGQT